MDGSLLCFDFYNNVLECALAHNPIWIARTSADSTVELIEVKGDRFPIGKHDRDHEPFTLHTISLQKGDVVYILTDGFVDQFGGASGKKFKYKQLKELLLLVSKEPMQIQREMFNTVFENWRGDQEQVDDVTVVGVRI